MEFEGVDCNGPFFLWMWRGREGAEEQKELGNEICESEMLAFRLVIHEYLIAMRNANVYQLTVALPRKSLKF